MDEQNTVSLDTLKEQGFTDEELAVHITTELEPQPEPSPEPTPEPINEPEPTPEPVEDITAPDSDKVSKHVPYDRFKEVNERNKVLAAELAALKAQQTTQQSHVQQPIQQQQTPQQQPQTDMYSQIKNYAQQEAIRKLNIEGNPQDLMYAEPEKYEEYLLEKATIINGATSVYNENREFANDLQAQPDFPVLYQFALNDLDEMPAKQARNIEQAFAKINQGFGSRKDMDIVQKYVDQCREKMNVVTSQPSTTQAAISTPVTTPTASPLDKAAGLPRANNLSGAKTSAMSWQQVEQLIREGKTDQIPKEMLAQIDKRLVE